MMINLSALNKFNAAASYAQEIHDNPTGGDDVVIHLQNGEELACNYSQTDAPRSMKHFLFLRSGDEKQLNDETRAVFKQAVIDIFGTSINDVPKSVQDAMELNKFNNTGRPLTARRILAVNTAIQAALASKLEAKAQQFGITGKAAVKILTATGVDTELANAADLASAYKERANRNATASMATHIAARAKDNFDYANFGADIERGTVITLGETTLTTKDAAEAANKVVQFLTGNANATMKNVDEHTRRKAAILMSILHQGTIACIQTGVNNGFDPTGKETRLGASAPTSFNGHQVTSFAVTKDANGNFAITGNVTCTGRLLLKLGDGVKAENKVTERTGAFAKYTGKIKLSAADLDKLADADWAKLDLKPITDVDSNNTIDDRFQTAADMIPDAYKFTGSVDVSFNLHADAILDLTALEEH